MRKIVSNGWICFYFRRDIRQSISFFCSGADDVGAVLVVAEYLACLEDDSVVVFGAVAHEAISDLCCAVVVLEEGSLFERGAHRLHLRPHSLVLLRPERLCCLRAD